MDSLLSSYTWRDGDSLIMLDQLNSQVVNSRIKIVEPREAPGRWEGNMAWETTKGLAGAWLDSMLVAPVSGVPQSTVGRN